MLANFTLEEFAKAKDVEGDMICTIRNHKTKEIYAAPITLPLEIYEGIQIYIEQFRPWVVKCET
jgi:hypothetical protein